MFGGIGALQAKRDFLDARIDKEHARSLSDTPESAPSVPAP